MLKFRWHLWTKCIISLVWLLLGSSRLFYSSSPIPELALPQKELTHAVLKRFYTIHRLEKICTNFFSTRDHGSLIDLLPSFLQATFVTTTHPALPALNHLVPLVHHEHLRVTIVAARDTRTLEPLHKLWKDICAYRFLHDTFLIEEFCQVLYLLLTHTMHDSKKSEKDSNTTPDPTDPLTAAITATDTLAITQRFYLIQRLHHAATLCLAKYGSSPDPTFAIMRTLWEDIQQYKQIKNPAVSFAICSSIIALLDSLSLDAASARPKLPPPVQADEASSPTLCQDSSSDCVVDNQAELEKLLAYIDALTDSYQYKITSTI